MRSIDIVRRAGRNLRQSKIRTLLTSLAIAVGAFTIMVSLAAGEGARQYADNLIQSNVDPDSLFIVKDKSIVGQADGGQSDLQKYDPDVAESGRTGSSVKQLNKSDIAKLRKQPYLRDVRPVYSLSADYVRFGNKKQKYISPMGIYNPEVLAEHVAGKKYDRGKDLGKGQAIVPESFAKTLKVTPEQLVGKKVAVYVSRDPQKVSQKKIQQIIATKGVEALTKLSQRETKKFVFTIKEVVKESDLSFSFSSALQVSLSDGNMLADYANKGTKQYHKYFAATAKVVTEQKSPEQAKDALAPYKLYAQTANDLQGFLFSIVNVLQGIVAGFGIVALLASIFGIVNTQYISVLERTSQIGLMKALGMRSRDVSRLFRYEAAWIGFLGGVIGIVIAWLVGESLNPWIAQAADLPNGTYLLIFKPLQAAVLIISLVLVAIIAGYFPSRKAAKLDPIEALRTE